MVADIGRLTITNTYLSRRHHSDGFLYVRKGGKEAVMNRRDTSLLILLLAAVIAGTVGCCAWLVVHLRPLAHLLLIMFLAASG